MWVSYFAERWGELASCRNSKRKQSNENDLARPRDVYISLCNDSLGSNLVVCRIVVVKQMHSGSVSATGTMKVRSALDVQELFGPSKVYI